MKTIKVKITLKPAVFERLKAQDFWSITVESVRPYEPYKRTGESTDDVSVCWFVAHCIQDLLDIEAGNR